MKVLLQSFLLFTLLPINLMAQQNIVLSTITSDFKKDYFYELSINVDKSGKIQSIQSTKKPHNTHKVYPTELLNKEITLVKSIGISLVTLKCIGFTPTHGCDIEISYPYNISYGNFDSFAAQLRKVGGKWGLYSSKGEAFNNMQLVSKKMLGLLVGIKRINLSQK